MHHSHSSHQNQRTNPHLEALPSNKNDLPSSCPETVRKKACTDVKKLRVRPRRPDMQLYVPRARRSRAAPGTSIPVDAHSSENLQNCQIDNRFSNVPFEVTENCPRLAPCGRENKYEKRNHSLESSIEHQQYGSETDNLSESDNPNFKRSCNEIEDEKSLSSQCLQKCCSETILFNKNSVEDKNNTLNAQGDHEKIIKNQNSSSLSKESHIVNVPEVPDFEFNEFANQKDEKDISEHSHSALLVNKYEVHPDNCNISVCLDTVSVQDKLESSSDFQQAEESFPKENNMQSESTETKGLNDKHLSIDSKELQTDTDVKHGKQESSAEGKESTSVVKKEASPQVVTNNMQCKDYVSESEAKNVEQEHAETKSKDVSNDDSLLKSSTDIDFTSQPTESGIALDSSDVADKSANDDSWDSLFDDSGECLNPEILKELTTTVGNVKITKSKYNYFEFQPHEPDVSGDEFGHIVEFYDFPVEFKNQDLLTIFSAFKNEAFNIKWVDDTHALGVFSSPLAAMDALSLNHPLLKVRPLSQGVRESKFKAKRCAEFLQPYKPRPETSASIARRLVSGALGMRVQIPKEQRELERKKLQEAKDRRRQAAKQKQDIWDGVVS